MNRNVDLISVENMYFDDSCFFVPSRLFCDSQADKLLEKEAEEE